MPVWQMERIVSESNSKPKCIIPNCDSHVGRLSRGLCRRCYHNAIYAIKNNKTTWQNLEELGLALPCKKIKPSHSLFGVALESAMKQAEAR